MNIRKLFLLISILFIAQIAISQKSSDIIFPVDGKIIKNCHIVKIKKNSVSYLLNERTHTVETKAVVRRGYFTP